MADYIDLYSESGWQDAPEYSDETRKKVLLDETDSKIILISLPAGFSMAPHSHLMSEQHIILKGEYESDGNIYTEGAYRNFDAQQRHGPFSSKQGALVLVIWKT